MNTTPPTQCDVCGSKRSAEDFVQISEGGRWLEHVECLTCKREREKRLMHEARSKGVNHYREKIPKKYRMIDDGGVTDIKHPDWINYEGGKKLAHMRKWINSGKDWAAIVGDGGYLKSRVMGVFAKDLAIKGHLLHWVNGSNLNWANSARYGSGDDKGTAWNAISKMKSADMLILDDLWKGSLNQSYFSVLYEILEHRSQHCKPMIWTANTHPNDIAQNIPDDLRSPIVGRLIENTHLLEL